jgi:hypothetical protein
MQIDMLQALALLAIAAGSIFTGVTMQRRVAALEERTGADEEEEGDDRSAAVIAELRRALPPWRTDLHRILESADLWVGIPEMRDASCDGTDCPLHNPRGFARKVTTIAELRKAFARLSDTQRRELVDMLSGDA